MAEDHFQERTEDASPRKREKAREEGQVARSAEVNAAAIITLGFMTLFLLGPFMAGKLGAAMTHILGHAAEFTLTTGNFAALIEENLYVFLVVFGPVCLALLAVGIGASALQVGFKVSPKALAPKFTKLNPMTGLKRLVSLRSLVHIVRDGIKLLIVAVVAYQVIQAEFESFFLLPDMSVPELALRMGKLALMVTLKIGVAVFVLAILDYLYQRWEFAKSIRMTKQELKEEYKDVEGSPQVKSRVRQLQREMSRKRMMQDVPSADVVITNPIHYAVALKYDVAKMNAPYVVAKGERLIAQRIKELALENDVPVIEDRQLARALYKLCEVGQMVPQTLFRAVAEILAYVYRLKDKAPDGMRSGG